MMIISLDVLIAGVATMSAAKHNFMIAYWRGISGGLLAVECYAEIGGQCHILVAIELFKLTARNIERAESR